MTALACAGFALPAHTNAADAAQAAPAAAAPSPVTAQTGTIEGRVFNAASGTYLNNAHVTVPGTSIEAFTDDSGTFRLREVPVGTNQIKVGYTGQKDIVEAVAVEAGGVTKLNFTFNSDTPAADAKTLKLNAFVVESSRFRNAQELATNEERASTNIKSVVALDSLGYMTDGNVGEFVRFMPGVDLAYGDSGGNGTNPDNPVNVGIRGYGATDTAITIDGMPVSSSAVGGNGALTRAFALDALSINNATRLEIIKVATPDMPQESPGGAINLITRGAFELPRATYKVSLAFNGNFNTPDVFKKTPGAYGPIYKTLPNIRASVTIPLTKTLGITASVSKDPKYNYTFNTSMRDWFFTNRNVTINGVSTQVRNASGGIGIHNPVVDRYEKVDNQWEEDRYAGNLRFDWKPFSGLEIRLNGQFSTYENSSVFRRTQWRFGTNGIGILDWGDGYVRGRTRTSTFNPGYSASITTDARDKEGFTTSGYLTAKYRKGPLSIDAKATASEAFTALVDRKNGHFSTVDASVSPWRMDLEGIGKGVVGAINLYDSAGNPINYGLPTSWNNILSPGFEARSSDTKSRDLNKLYQLDAAYEADFLRFPLTLKGGYLMREKKSNKWGAGTGYRMRYIGPSTGVPTNTDLQSDFFTEAGVGYTNPMFWPDAAKIYQVYQAHPEWFDDAYVSATENVNYAAINYASRVGSSKGLTTTNFAWYGMATAKFFENRLTILAGARQERRDNLGYNLFIDPKPQYIKDASGFGVYRDSVYTAGVRFNGEENTSYPAGDPRRAATAILTDTALRSRLQAAGVKFIPNQLELNPNGTRGERERNLKITQLARYLRYIDTSITQPYTPQAQAVYNLTKSLKLQVAWSNETRIPEIEASNGFLSGNSGFEISEPEFPNPGVEGGDGVIKVSNVSGTPEEVTSYNAKLAFYPQNGRGQYSVSWYYKISNKAWETLDLLPSDQDYNLVLEGLGLSANDYRNYTITYTTATDDHSIRRGFEAEMRQNMGVIGDWAKGIDVYGSFTWQPASKVSDNTTVLGWTTDIPDRNIWKGSISYSARRFSVQASFNYRESGITHVRTNTVTMPDGTNQSVRFYRPNHNPLDLKLQGNYVFNKYLTFFATFDRVLSRRTYTQETDILGLQPHWASYRQMQDKGVKFAVGVDALF